MRGGFAGWGLVGLLAMSAAVSATNVLPPGAVLIDGTTPKSDPARLAVDAGAVLEHVARGDESAALAKLRKIDDPLAFELTAARVIRALSLEGGGDALLDALDEVPARVFRRHEETKADWFVPVFDIAGQAKSLQQQRARRQQAVALRAELLADPAAAAKQERAWPEAVSLLSEAEVDRVAAAVAAKGAAADPGAVVALAARSKRADVWNLALDLGEPVDVLPLFEQVDALLPADHAKAWVARAARDPRYGSAAVFASARLPGDALQAWLDDAALGASAAAALAQRDGEAFVAKVDALTGPKASERQLRHVALALRLIGTPAAQDRLHTLAEDPRLPEHVRTELQR